MGSEIVDLQSINSRGLMIVCESGVQIPFDVKRSYIIYNNEDNERRGFHAHKKLKQMLICLKGSCKVTIDDGSVKKTYSLDNPSKGLLLTPCVWREIFDFSHDAILMALVSENYDESDYIRDYDEFVRYVRK